MSSRPMPGGMLWIFRAAGITIIVVGLWLCGGQELTCIGAPAECRLQTTRWLGASVSEDATYGGITRVDTIHEAETGQRERHSDGYWYVGLYARDAEVGRVFARREQVQVARNQLSSWLDAGSRGESRVVWSSWDFGLGACAFGLVWLIALTLMSRRR